MKATPEHNERVAQLVFATVYPLYVKKIERKGRSKKELDMLIEWLTGFNNHDIEKMISKRVTFKKFFQDAKLNPQAHKIKGLICGYRIEEIENDLTRQVRYLDKIVDELAKGKKLDKILRSDIK